MEYCDTKTDAHRKETVKLSSGLLETLVYKLQLIHVVKEWDLDGYYEKSILNSSPLVNHSNFNAFQYIISYNKSLQDKKKKKKLSITQF